MHNVHAIIDVFIFFKNFDYVENDFVNYLTNLHFELVFKFDQIEEKNSSWVNKEGLVFTGLEYPVILLNEQIKNALFIYFQMEKFGNMTTQCYIIDCNFSSFA